MAQGIGQELLRKYEEYQNKKDKEYGKDLKSVEPKSSIR
jgi:hypothetical protein